MSFLCGKSGIVRGPFETRAPALRYVEGRGKEGRYPAILAGVLDHFPVSGDQEAVCEDPGGGAGKAGHDEPEAGHQKQAKGAPGHHLKEPGKHRHLAVAHALDQQAEHVHPRPGG